MAKSCTQNIKKFHEPLKNYENGKIMETRI